MTIRELIAKGADLDTRITAGGERVSGFTPISWTQAENEAVGFPLINIIDLQLEAE